MQTFSTSIARSAWTNRFCAPTPEDVIDGIHPLPRLAFARARQMLAALDEEFIWQGVWKWSFVYTRAVGPWCAAAFLIPDPIKPRMCIPLDKMAVAKLTCKPLSPLVRAALCNCPIIENTRWPSWVLSEPSAVEEILGSLIHAQLRTEPLSQRR